MKKKQYKTPEIEVMEARIEKGFTLSAGDPANTTTEEVTDSQHTYTWN